MAEGHIAEGDKHASSGFFKKPNWDAAAASYQKAAAAYRVAKAPDAARQAHQKAAHAWHQAGSLFNAAKQVEAAASQATDGQDKAALLDQAGELYGQAGNTDKVAPLLVEAARAAADNEERWRTARAECVGDARLRGQCTQALLALLCGRAQWGDAAALCADEAALHERARAQWTAARVVLLLQHGDTVAAQRACDDCDSGDDVMRGARDLVSCMRDNDAAALAALQRGTRLNYIEPCVVRVFRAFRLAGGNSGGATATTADEEDMT